MLIRANAKINWTLDTVGVRADGYHLLDMLMQSISLHDTLTLEPAQELTFSADGATRVPQDEGNLALRAALALRRHTGTERGATIHLHKRIPSGAGLGGGSADAAAVLHGLNALWELNLPMETLRQIGLTLGADVPFCLTGGLCRARGLGEALTPLPSRSRRVLLVKPAQGLSTPEVFHAFDRLARPDPADNEAAARALALGDDELLARSARNMLIDAAISLCPEVRETLLALRELGASFCAMSGSGSACLALFPEKRFPTKEELCLCPSFCLPTYTTAG